MKNSAVMGHTEHTDLRILGFDYSLLCSLDRHF